MHRIIFHSGKAWLSNPESYQLNSWWGMKPLKRAGVGMYQFFQSTLLTFTLLNKQQKNLKSTLKKGNKFLFENDCHDNYCRLIWTINSCRGECFKSLRKNERPHNVNSCDKCSCTAGGNGYCNHIFKLYKCLNSLNSQELECAQLKTVAQTKDLGYEP